MKYKYFLKFNNNFIRNQRNYCELKTYLSTFESKHPLKECEKFWSHFWQKNRLFAEENAKKCGSGPLFSLLLPPPNITGSLHLGHALTLSIEDSICRYHRMKGHTVVWIPGLDHAGIATQMMVEKMLWSKRHKTRHDLSREQFLAEVNEWKNQRSLEIKEQLLRLGVSLDFEKEFYTLSDEMSEAVNEAFIRLFNSGQIYRRSLAVNWSFFLQSTISDIEVEYKKITAPTLLTVPGYDGNVLVGVMHTFNFPIEGQTSDVIPVATTRLETILADVAIAVHPNDSRYSQLIGKNAINPLNGSKMPIISDESVRPDFGTGAVKITPAYSVFDYTIAEKHSLPIVEIFNDSGHIDCPDLPQFHGLHRFSAKDVMRNELQNRGLYVSQSDHIHSIPLCSRSGDIIESKRVPQWFLKCEKESILAQFVVNRDNMSETDEQKWILFKDLLKEEDKHMSIIPPNYRNVWKEWFGRYEDWCISRQIYWGHRIPAYNIVKDNQLTDEWIVAKSESEAQTMAQNKYPSNEISVKQDTDVLDTWFSSALLPLTINGWPKIDSTQLKYFPLSLMETGRDIIFFWVARMCLLSLSLTNKLPFHRVLLHGMVCDADGKKMSKSKGNVIDPIDVMDGISLKDMKQKNIDYFDSGILSKTQLDNTLKQLSHKFPNGIIDCGADALRFHLLQLDFKEENCYFGVNHVIANRKFCNKMHQTVRFLMANIDDSFELIDILSLNPYLTPIDRWIISCLVDVIKQCNQSFASYDLQYSALQLRHFWINLLCDIYLEYIKQFIYNNEDIQRRNCVLNVLSLCIMTSLRAIHPFMPFISENLWQHLNQKLFKDRDQQPFKSICDESYPDLSADKYMIYFDFKGIKEEMYLCHKIIKKIRWFKSNFKIEENILQNYVLIAINGNYLENYKNLIQNTSKVSGIKFVSIHEIHKYDKCFCYKIQFKQNFGEKETNEEVIETTHSYNDCYVLFNVDFDSIIKSMSESGIKPEIITQKSSELEEYKCTHFHKNYWPTKSLLKTNA